MTDTLKVDDRVQQLKDITDIQEKDLNIDNRTQQLPKKDVADKKINEIEEKKISKLMIRTSNHQIEIW